MLAIEQMIAADLGAKRDARCKAVRCRMEALAGDRRPQRRRGQWPDALLVHNTVQKWPGVSQWALNALAEVSRAGRCQWATVAIGEHVMVLVACTTVGVRVGRYLVR